MTDQLTTTTPTNWRDVQGLTDEQRNELDRREELLADGRDAEIVREWLLNDAREYAKNNAADRERYGDVPAPDGAFAVWNFELDAELGPVRYFEGPATTTGGVTTGIGGQQRPDGSVTAWVDIDGSPAGNHLSAADARALAAALVEAADRIDAVTGTPVSTPPAAGDVLSALRALAGQVEAEHDAADPAVRFIYRSELSGVRRAVGVAETVVGPSAWATVTGGQTPPIG